MKRLTWPLLVGTASLVITVAPGLSPAVHAHGRPSQTANCHMNVGRRGYHCHPQRSQSQVTPQPTPQVSPAPLEPVVFPPPPVPVKPKAGARPQRGCALQDQLNVHRRPQQQARVLHRLERNQCVFLNTRPFTVSGNPVSWVKVTLPDGRRGYVESDALNQF